MIRVEPAFEVVMFIREFALLEVVKETIIGHDVRGVEGAAHGFLGCLAHFFYYYYSFKDDFNEINQQ